MNYYDIKLIFSLMIDKTGKHVPDKTYQTILSQPKIPEMHISNAPSTLSPENNIWTRTDVLIL